ncbi:glycoside hydrolase family 43 protein [Chaetomium strumarium]|uniref:Glycoside hydrolase family 43 protein n=1 Tax=Chaetomium strumarium TaxID=1170767 RepID=A0AAJ0GNU7_9PEZI|nr:glycoside hydrolase family 43 protein [Chaetomium strumarium]
MAGISPGRLFAIAFFLSTWSCIALGLAIDTAGYSQVARYADPNLAGYLGVFFLGADPYVYFYLSNGNDPVSFKALNGGSPVIRPTKGTGGVRDPTIIPGSGSEAGKKWYIIGTDLNIGKTTWDAAQRTGSRGIFVWESSDLVKWGNERLVVVEDATAGMVWAPEAIWDPAKGQYLVHWASKFYSASDPRHTGSPTTTIRIRYAYTSDFRTFTAPQTLIDKSPTNIIDLTILPFTTTTTNTNTNSSSNNNNNNNNNNSFLRFMKDETRKTVFVEVSETGLFGTWTRPGGDSAVIEHNVEGPAAYWDNAVPGKVHLLVDFYGGDGYRPYESTNPRSNAGWVASSTTSSSTNAAGFPRGLRHGSVLPVDERLYAALKARWG